MEYKVGEVCRLRQDSWVEVEWRKRVHFSAKSSPINSTSQHTSESCLLGWTGGVYLGKACTICVFLCTFLYYMCMWICMCVNYLCNCIVVALWLKSSGSIWDARCPCFQQNTHTDRQRQIETHTHRHTVCIYTQELANNLKGTLCWSSHSSWNITFFVAWQLLSSDRFITQACPWV